jgi:hypothetical protein
VNDNVPTDGGNRGSSQAGKNEYGLKRLGQGASTLRQYGKEATLTASTRHMQ